MKNGSEVTLNLSSNVFGDSNDETNFPHKLLLTYTQVLRLRKSFANGSSANIKFSKTQLSKMVQLGVIMQDLFNFPVDPGKIVCDGLNKERDLAKNVQDNDFIKTAKVAGQLKNHRKINSVKYEKMNLKCFNV